MATGGDPAHEERREALTCSLCLEIYTSPKLLPCSHSFCVKCLQDLTTHLKSKTFPCPQCREQVTVPQGGVGSFQNNFYLNPQDLDKARDGTLCLTHSNQELDLYCEDCKLAVCLKCVLTKHKLHSTKDLSEAASEAKSELKLSQARLQEALSYVIDEVTSEKKELKDVQDKKAALQEAIKNKHATLVALANKVRDVSLASLDTVSGEIESQVSKELDIKQNNLDELSLLQQQTQQAIDSGTSCKLLTVAKEMREGRGSPQAVKNLTSAKRSNVWRPGLNREVAEDAIEQSITKFFGSVQKLRMKAVTPEVTAKEMFSCGDGDDTEVFSLCPLDKDTVWMSFARRKAKDDAPCEKFDIKGASLGTQINGFGKQTYKCRGRSIGMSTTMKKGDLMQTFEKSQKRTIFKLNNHSAKEAVIKSVKVTSEDPFKVEHTLLFSIKVGTHRAFDVDSSEQLFAVLEEAQSPGGQRKVLLYRRDQHTPVSTYTPPTAYCQPSDVCFYRLGGREVLLVADQGTDSVHVLHVKGDELKFDRYLAPGCPLLVQPTALNTDTQGRLWVACRGGDILTFTPIA
ncbi:tripartite motif-containing protein 54-like [Littorina saxatilis]|uniref:tripartite motif-containing protein 54-like n=1 Tax=Littorina saxatilis TaxID=31220 RepID=UPI0038B492B8